MVKIVSFRLCVFKNKATYLAFAYPMVFEFVSFYFPITVSAIETSQITGSLLNASV